MEFRIRRCREHPLEHRRVAIDGMGLPRAGSGDLADLVEELRRMPAATEGSGSPRVTLIA
ncbi:MAG: hypothetical protein QM755_17890 [Luteolibacter sp.]